MAQDAATVFEMFDKDFDGKLHPLELHQALGALGLCPSIEEVQVRLKEGANGGDLELFRQLIGEFQGTKPTAQSLQPLFKIIDPSSSGKIDVSSLRYLLTNFNEKLSDAETEEFFVALKLPASGLVEISDISAKLEALVK